MAARKKPPCLPCAKRAKKLLDGADRYGIPLPRPVRRHFERTAAKIEPKPDISPTDRPRRVRVRQGGD